MIVIAASEDYGQKQTTNQQFFYVESFFAFPNVFNGACLSVFFYFTFMGYFTVVWCLLEEYNSLLVAMLHLSIPERTVFSVIDLHRDVSFVLACNCHLNLRLSLKVC